MDVTQLRQQIVRPTLKKMRAWARGSEEIVLGTSATESDLGRYVVQINGPALGIFQMEPDTHDDIWINFLSHPKRKALADVVAGFASGHNLQVNNTVKVNSRELITNPAYATAMVRSHYLRFKPPLPSAGDLVGQGVYYKKYYNTPKGKGSVRKYIEDYKRFITTG